MASLRGILRGCWRANRRRCLSTTNPEQFESLRIAICGSGVVGPTFAGLLSRRLGELTQSGDIHLSIDMFERAPPDSDQGYGLDLDEFGQEALVQAGVYDRFWEIARPVSETSAIYSLCGAPLFVATKPGLQPECNRAGLRQLMIDAAEANTKRFGKPTEMPGWDGSTNRFNMHFDTQVQDIKRVTSSASDIDTLELMGSRGKGPQELLGEFDLVVDCMGWSSTLRKYRMSECGDEGEYDGTVIVHGSLPNPMESADEDVKSVFGADNGRGYGTIVVVGGGHKSFVFQQYGAGADDKRHALLSYYERPGDPDSIFEEIGIPKPTSRNTGLHLHL